MYDWKDAGGKTHRLTLARYARELYGADLDRPDGREAMRGRYVGRRGAVRDRTREQWRADVERFWLPELGARPLESLTAADLRRVIDRLVARDGKNYLADGSIRRLFAPMSPLLATAAEEGSVAGNVARDGSMPSGRDRLRKLAAGIDDEEDESEAKALTREQLDTFWASLTCGTGRSSGCWRRPGCTPAGPSRSPRAS